MNNKSASIKFSLWLANHGGEPCQSGMCYIKLGDKVEYKSLEDLYDYFLEQQPVEPNDELPNLTKSTENLSKIKNKDEWLDEVRGKDEKLEELEKWCDEVIKEQHYEIAIAAFDEVKEKIQSLKQQS